MNEKWNTSRGRAWVVVAFWGEETTVEFYGLETDAEKAYKQAVDQGADTFYAKTQAMRVNK